MKGYVYILTNRYHRVLYTGVTADPFQRLSQHRRRAAPGFTKKYNVDKLVYLEDCGDIETAILREKQIKGGSRRRKIDLITAMNPEWRDLAARFPS